MAKYNILSDSDDFAENKENSPKKDISKKPDEKDFPEIMLSSNLEEQEKQTPGDDYFSDEIFPPSSKLSPELSSGSDDPFMTEDPGQDPGLHIPPAREPETMSGYEETGVGEYPATVGESEKKPIYIYEDDYKQEGLNYKPILIGLGAVAAVVVIFFIISNLFFSNEEEQIPQQKTETAAEKLEREQTERKQNFLAEINKTRRIKLNGVNFLAGQEQKNVKYSSILLYGNTLDFEIFVPNRDVLAKYNIKIKDNQQIEKYKIEGVDFRPGKNGGFFALYNINLKSDGNLSSAALTNFQAVNPEAWAGTVLQPAGATVKAQRTISSRQENLFRVNRFEYELRGSLQNFFALIAQLASTNQNISIHKLTLLPADQRKMSPSAYVLKLVVDFYL